MRRTAWDAKLISQRHEAEAAHTARCDACGQRLPPIALSSAIGIALDEYGMELDELLGRGQDQVVAGARALIVWALRTLGEPVSYPEIGKILRRDSSAIINLHQKAIGLRLRSPAFAAACRRMADKHRSELEMSYAAH